MKRRIMLVFSLVLLCAVLVGCDGPIRGNVTDANTEAAIADADVFLLKKEIDWEPGYVLEIIQDLDPETDLEVIDIINNQLSDVSLDDQTTTDAEGDFLFEDKEGAAFYGALVFKQGYRLDFAMTSIDFLGLGLTSRKITLESRQ